jgi:8-oxo-dGTP pyrophosphatase MutT (NUDIX family)
VLVYPKGGELHLLLNKRSESVEDHKGEVSFPGGRMDECDGSLLDTALREAHEEVGVRPEDVRVLRRLEDVDTSTGYLVTPFLGMITEDYPFVVSRVEVAELVEVPVTALVDGSTIRDETRFEDGLPVSRPNYAYGGHLIWGATARILTGLLELLRADAAGDLLSVAEPA